MTPYLYIGTTHMKVSSNGRASILPSIPVESFDISNTNSGLTYGLGIDLFGNRHASLFFSWGRLIHKDIDGEDEFKMDMTSIGFRYYFYPQTTFSKSKEFIES